MIFDNNSQIKILFLGIFIAILAMASVYYEDIAQYFSLTFENDAYFDTKVKAVIFFSALSITGLSIMAYTHYLKVTGSQVYLNESYDDPQYE